MRRVHNGLLGVTAALAFAIGGVACDNTARGAKQDAIEAQQKADEKAAEAKGYKVDNQLLVKPKS